MASVTPPVQQVIGVMHAAKVDLVVKNVLPLYDNRSQISPLISTVCDTTVWWADRVAIG